MIRGDTAFKYFIDTTTDVPTEVAALFVGIFGLLKIPEKVRLILPHEFAWGTKTPAASTQ